MRRILLAVVSTASLLPNAIGQEFDRNAYPAEFFEKFSPQSAWDIVLQTPGFTVQESGDARGFQGNAGNVLVNGKRPLSKNVSLEDALRRIPATAVTSVELNYGAQAASDVGTRTIVLNVITNETAGSTTYRAEWALNSRYRQSGVMEVGTARRLGAWNVKASAEWQDQQFDYNSYERSSFDANDNLTLFQVEAPPEDRGRLAFDFEVERDFATGAAIGLSGLLRLDDRFRPRSRDRYLSRDLSQGPDSLQLIVDDSEKTLAELTFEIDNPLSANWSLRNLVFGSRTNEDILQTSEVTSADTTLSSRSFTTDTVREEYIWRFALNKSVEDTSILDLGGEVSFNTLTSDTSALNLLSDVSSIERVIVEETRFEPFARVNLNLPMDVLFEGGVSGEHVQISVRGDAERDDEVSYFLPSIVFKKVIGEEKDGNLVGLRISRDVGQLSFGDFAASAEFSEDQEFAGNRNLLPDDRWRYALFSELRSKSGPALSVEVFFEDINNPLEQVSFEDGSFGVSNVGDAERWGGSAKLSWPLDKFIKGGLLVADIDWEDSEVVDPQTGETRPLHFNLPLRSELEFRQDFSNRFSWGGKIRFYEEQDLFFADADRPFFRGTRIGLFAERNIAKDLRLKLSLDSIGGQKNGDDLLRYAPDRSGNLVSRRLSRRERSMYGTISLSGQF